MKVHILELPSGKNSTHYTRERVFLLALSLILLTLVPLYLLDNVPSSLHFPRKVNTESVSKCDMSNGTWVPYPNKEPYYTNSTCSEMNDAQNCMKFGRPDTEFLKWRWKPNGCELPIFDAVQFLELVRGKSMAFVGDSVGRNQMQSLVCLLTSVVHPVDITYNYTTNINFRRWFYTDYNFTIATFWSPYLVKARGADVNGHSRSSLMSLHLDEADEAWAAEIENFDYVIISAGQWFFQPVMFYENGQIIGCYFCNKNNITEMSKYYGYRMAFRTAFRTLQSLKNYKGMTILRTFSSSHFENGDYNKGGNCVRTRPFTSEDKKMQYHNLEFYLTQTEEFREAARQGRERGIKFRLIDTTAAMELRPDGHPNHYGHSQHENVTIADCTHWCLPGPIDTCNEFLLQVLKTNILEKKREIGRKEIMMKTEKI